MRFRFLQDHWVEGARIIPAGAVEDLPLSFQPSGAMEPLDQDALSAFYRAGVQLPRVHLTVNPPITAWRQIPGTKTYQLTGLGAGLEPKAM
jgi:hypothetical protein